ncbi:MAG: hypothetical protein DRO40_10110, partial [Thermoprotei archaeon]
MAEINSNLSPFRNDWGSILRPWHIKALEFIERYYKNKFKSKKVTILDLGTGRGRVIVYLANKLKQI